MATVPQWLDPEAARVFTTVAPPQLVQANGSNFPITGQAFSGTAGVEAMFFEVAAPSYGGGNLTAWVDFYTPATSNATVFQGAISATTPGDAQSLLTDAFATANVSSAVTSNATANGHSRATITISNTDSLAADDRFTLKIFRDSGHASDSNTSDAIVFGVWLFYDT